MNKRGQQALVGFSLLMVFFIFVLVIFGLIPVFKESLDEIRGTESINCPNTPGFNQTQFDEDDAFEFNQTVRRPTCFVTGVSMVWFISAFLLASVSWLAINFRKARR